jgi:hypothetical protein
MILAWSQNQAQSEFESDSISDFYNLGGCRKRWQPRPVWRRRGAGTGAEGGARRDPAPHALGGHLVRLRLPVWCVKSVSPALAGDVCREQELARMVSTTPRASSSVTIELARGGDQCPPASSLFAPPQKKTTTSAGLLLWFLAGNTPATRPRHFNTYSTRI